MKYRTELMQSILTSERAQKIVEYVSPIYGDSYVGLWLYEVIGASIDPIGDICSALMAEANPTTANLLLDYWEDHYGLPRDESLTKGQRQGRLMAKIQLRGPCNTERLTSCVSSALGGAEVEITENISKNKFLVNIREVVPSVASAEGVLDKMKPAHLIYEIRVATQSRAEAGLKTAVAVTHAEIYKVEVHQ